MSPQALIPVATMSVKMTLGGTAMLPAAAGAVATISVSSVTQGTQTEPAKK